MDNETAAIAQRLNAARREQGVGILPLSLTTGTPYTNLQQFFAGKRDLHIGKVAQVARELNLKPSAYMPDFSVTTPETTAAA
jgi:hypothetical protein